MDIENEIVTVKLADLKEDEKNPNRMTQDQRKGLKKSLQKFKNIKLVLIDQNNVIIDGHQRVDEMKALGVQETKAIRYKVTSEAERVQLRQVANKLYGEHDKKMDADDFLVLFKNQKLDELAELLARPQEEFQRALEKHHGIEFVKEDGFDVDAALKEPPITKTGDIWQLGRHRLMCGDSTKKEDVDSLMDGKTADLLLTDPPYGVDYGSKNRFLNSIWFANRIEEPIFADSNIDDYRAWFASWLSNIQLSETNAYYLTISDQKLLDLSDALIDTGFKISQYLVWVKNNHVLGRQDYANKHELIIYGWKGKHEFYGDFQTTVWEIDRPQKNQLHPTMKPIELASRMIGNSSKAESIVLDPFCGSGTTLIACEQLNRVCYAMEISPEYVTVIIRRWEALTGQKAQLIKETITKTN